KLPDEPGDYVGYQALYGAKYVDPAITGGNACVNNTEGQPVTDPFGRCGFPGFDGALAKNTLGYVAQMQESGVPVTYAYISDAHDNHTSSFPAPFDPNFPRASGPGEADYKAQLKAYDDAFAAFFDRLAGDGITKDNTLFVLNAIDPYVSSSPTPIFLRLADTVGEKALHMVNTDSARTPSFTAFGNPDYFVTDANPSCGSNPCIDYHFAWSHGDIQPEIATN